MILWTSWAFCLSGDKLWGREQFMQIRLLKNTSKPPEECTVSKKLYQSERLHKENGPTANIQCFIFPSLTGALVRSNQGNWLHALLTAGIYEKLTFLHKHKVKWKCSLLTPGVYWDFKTNFEPPPLIFRNRSWCEYCSFSHMVWSMSGVINTWCLVPGFNGPEKFEEKNRLS